MAKNLVWRKELEKIAKKTSKTDPERSSIVTQVTDITDELVAAAAYTSEQLVTVNDHCTTAVNSADRALTTSVGLMKIQDSHSENLKDHEKRLDKQSKQIEQNKNRAAKNANERNRLALEASQTVLIFKGVQPVAAGKESYTDLETALYKAVKVVGVRQGDGTFTINYIRRLPRPSETSGSASSSQRTRSTKLREQARLLRVELSSIGDKIRLFEAMTRASKAGKKFDFSVSTEIPKYALQRHKRMGRLAKILRDHEPELKTKVVIPRGKLLPVIQFKSRGSNEPYLPATSLMMERATKTLAAELKGEEEEELLEDDPMD